MIIMIIITITITMIMLICFMIMIMITMMIMMMIMTMTMTMTMKHMSTITSNSPGRAADHLIQPERQGRLLDRTPQRRRLRPQPPAATRLRPASAASALHLPPPAAALQGAAAGGVAGELLEQRDVRVDEGVGEHRLCCATWTGSCGGANKSWTFNKAERVRRDARAVISTRRQGQAVSTDAVSTEE